MIGNPEFRRNWWQGATLTRGLIVGLLLMLVLVAAAAVDFATARRGRPDAFDALAAAARWSFFVVTVIWGGWLAAASVVHEIRDRTWDAQRMSALTPWTLGCGKLFGAPALAWVFGLAILAVYVPAAASESGWTFALIETARLTGAALLCHAVALFASLVRTTARAGEKPGNSFVLFLLAFTFSGFVYGGPSFLAGGIVDFYGLAIPRRSFSALSVWGFALLFLAGVYWRMRLALQIRTRPWIWLLFLVAFAAYAAGFMAGTVGDVLRIAAIVLLYTFVAYGLILIEPKDTVAYRRGFVAFRRGRLGAAFELAPLWFLTYLALLLAVTVELVLLATGTHVLRLPAGVRMAVSAEHYLIALALFVTRDLAIVLFFAAGGEAKRAELMGFLCWLILYVPVPVILSVTNLDRYIALFLPTGDRDWTLAVVPALAQAALVAALAAWRWRRASHG